METHGGTATVEVADPFSRGPMGARPAGRRLRWWWVAVAFAVVVLLIGIGASGGAFATPTPAPAPTAVPYDARGRVVPIRQARVATLQGGIVRSVGTTPGAPIADRAEVARVESAGGVEVVVAPFAGTVLAVNLHVGDGVLPGTEVAQIGDLSALRVETLDVDEYRISRLVQGQGALVTVDALGERRDLRGRVASVTLTPRVAPNGDQHYPVVIALEGGSADLRPGMSARIRFDGEASG